MATFASDNFTDSNGVALQSHTPTGGGAWTKVIGGAGIDIEIYGNGASPSGNSPVYYHATAPAGVEYDVTATITRTGNSASTVGISARQSSSAETNYLAWPSTIWTLYKTVAGAFTSLGTYSTLPAVNDVFKLECKDATKKLFINGIERISSANNDVTAAGYAGIRGYGTSANTHIDVWLAEQAASGGGGPVGLSSESDAALALIASQRLAVGLAAETDAALALAAGQVLTVGLAAETDSSFALPAVQVAPVGLAIEIDAAVELAAGGAAGAVGLTIETDSALALSASQSAAVGLASESDTALPLLAWSLTASVGLAVEVDAAFALIGSVITGDRTAYPPALAAPAPDRTAQIGAMSRTLSVPEVGATAYP